MRSGGGGGGGVGGGGGGGGGPGGTFLFTALSLRRFRRFRSFSCTSLGLDPLILETLALLLRLSFDLCAAFPDLGDALLDFRGRVVELLLLRTVTVVGVLREFTRMEGQCPHLLHLGQCREQLLFVQIQVSLAHRQQPRCQQGRGLRHSGGRLRGHQALIRKPVDTQSLGLRLSLGGGHLPHEAVIPAELDRNAVALPRDLRVDQGVVDKDTRQVATVTVGAFGVVTEGDLPAGGEEGH